MRASPRILAAACLVFNLSGPLGGRASAQDQSVTATFSGIDNSFIIVDIRASDFAANDHTCTTGGSGGGCTVGDEQSFVPKNIGNMLCVPCAIGKIQIDSSCQALLDEVKGCQKNSASAKCFSVSGNDYCSIAPACNYQTSSTASTPASWSWQLNYDVAQNLTLQCAESGYQGTAD